MASTNNPAGRIYEVLRSAKRLPPQTLVRNVWAQVLGADGDHIHTVYARLIRLDEQFEEAGREVRALDVNHELYLKSLPVLRAAVSPTNLDSSWQDFRNKITEEALTSLEFCSDLLERRVPEKTIPEEELAQFAQEINELLESLLSKQEIPDSAKVILVDLVRALQDALTEYRIRGVRGMRAAIFEVVARLERNRPVVETAKDDKDVSRLMRLLTRWDTVTSALVNTTQLAGQALPPLLQMSGLS